MSLHQQVMRTQLKILASMSLSLYLGKWNLHRYIEQNLRLSSLLLNSFVYSFSPPCATVLQASCRSLARLESVQDMHTTIYDVIRHDPEVPSHSLLN